MSAPLLEVRDLSVIFPPRRGNPAVQALKGISFDLQAGQTLALVGESGSGKTTTGRAVLRLQPTAGGSVKLKGRELTTMSGAELRKMRRHMQFVLQNPYSSLNPRMTVAQILSEPLLVHGTLPKSDFPAKVAELLEMVGLDPAWASRYPHQFSGGQRQRIVIARALAVNPDFVVCDEPVSALDVRTQAQIVRLLQGLQKRLGVSYLFISHDLAVVQEMSHRVAVMFGGRIVELGETAQVYRKPTHPYTRMLLDSVPVPDVEAQRARLKAPMQTPEFPPDQPAPGPCAFGEDHAVTGTAPWHDLGGGHCVSCRYWPK